MEDENVSDSKFVNSIPYIMSGIFFVIILLLVFQNFFDNNKKDIDAYEVIVKKLSSNGYLKTVDLEVIANTPKAVEYSFDGGYTWQKDNLYTATSNGELVIYVKDSEGEIVKKNFNVSSIDNKGPLVSYTYDKKIYVGDKINTSSLFKISDDVSGVSKDVTFVPSTIDTEKSGTKNATVKAIDSVGNPTNLTFEISVFDKKSTTKDTTTTKEDNKTSDKTNKDNDKTKTVTEKEKTVVEKEKTKYYRYRTKTTVEYKCNSYSCNEEDIIDVNTEIVSTGKCPSNYKTSDEKTSNGCLVPSPIDSYCTAALTPVYVKDSNGLYYSRIAISAEKKDKEFKKAPCGENETEINGYCHPICEKIDSKTKEKVSTGKCIDNYKTCSQQFSNTCVVPTPIEYSCGQAMTNRFRKNQDGLLYDGYAIYTDGSSPACNDKYSSKSKTEASLGSIYDNYKKAPCDENEKEMNGVCFAMCEKKKTSCEKGYFLEDNKCKKIIENTCYETCSNSTWGEWSKWSTQKVVADSNTQVEEKYE